MCAGDAAGICALAPCVGWWGRGCGFCGISPSCRRRSAIRSVCAGLAPSGVLSVVLWSWLRSWARWGVASWGGWVPVVAGAWVLCTGVLGGHRVSVLLGVLGAGAGACPGGGYCSQ